ncbi:hypothetical protein GCM10009547_36010 [Sporichthya brevicatena]|uniref:NERD domain-containing protein n=1 Tax=Sporichthya brevicatena TaxID=171442 RepID=A0ABN1H547_9ACTN
MKRSSRRDDAGDATSAGSPAGASARREYDRRRAQREDHARARFPRIGGLLLALNEEPTSTRVWDQGAKGEEAVGAVLDGIADVLVLHDRRLNGGSRANIDHLVVAASGVWVVDTKTHKGDLEVRRLGGVFRPREDRLLINGRDRTSLIEGLQRQVETVQRALITAQLDVPVHGALCFVGTTLPWTDKAIDGIPLIGRRGLRKAVQRRGDLDAAARASVAALLDSRFPPA